MYQGLKKKKWGFSSPKILRKLNFSFFSIFSCFQLQFVPCHAFLVDHGFTRKESTIELRLPVQTKDYICLDKLHLRYIQTDEQHQKLSSGVGCIAIPGHTFGPSLVRPHLSNFWEAFRSQQAPGIILNRQFGCRHHVIEADMF